MRPLRLLVSIRPVALSATRIRASLIPCLVAALTWAPAAQASPLPERQAIAITDVTIIDVEHGRLIGPRTVLVDGVGSSPLSRHATRGSPQPRSASLDEAAS